MLLCIASNRGYAMLKTSTIHPVATHAMAMVFGYVTNEQRDGKKDIEPFIHNPFTGRLENSGVITRLADLFNQNKAYILTNSSLFRAMLKWYPNIQLEKWRCKAINDFVYLFIQNALLPPENQQNAVALVPEIQKLEPLLGVKISDKATISSSELRSPYYITLPSKNFDEECANILKAIWDGTQSKIFLTKSDYEKSPIYQSMKDKPVIPVWAFLMLGFGQQSESLTKANGIVCGLTIATYRQILDFFTAQLSVGMVVVASSYFPDINLVASLKMDDRPELKKLPFTLISASITGSPLLSGTGVEELHDYEKFFTTLLPPLHKETLRVNWQPDPTNFEEIISLACRPYRYFIGSEEHMTTPIAIPIMRLTNQPFFTHARFNGDVALIHDALIKPDLAKQPLYLRELMNPNKGNEQVVPNTLVITCTKEFSRPLVLTQRADKKLPTMIGSNAGPRVYVFDEIDAQTARISDVVEAFIRIPELMQDQAFIIKKLRAINNISKLISVNRPVPEDSFYQLKIIHRRTGKSEERNMILLKQLDCLKDCVEKPMSTNNATTPLTDAQINAIQKPMYTVVAEVTGTTGDKIDIKWEANRIDTGKSLAEKTFDEIIDTIKKTELPATLELFAS